MMWRKILYVGPAGVRGGGTCDPDLTSIYKNGVDAHYVLEILTLFFATPWAIQQMAHAFGKG